MSLLPYLEREVEVHQHAPQKDADHGVSFDLLVADSIRQIRDKAEGLTRAESRLLSDVQRRTYASFRTVAQVADIARYRCKDPGAAASLAEAIRGYTLSGHPGLVLPWFDTLRYEGATNAIADEALLEFILRPGCKSAKERMIETHVAQSIASRAVADLVWSERR